MEDRTTLPLDIVLYIIDLLADGDNEDDKSLRILSQTCKSMVPLCRKHLFSSLSLITKLSFERFSDLLSKNPDIACYVRNLDYEVYNPGGDHELNILDILKERSSLQSIVLASSMTSSRRFDWNDFLELTRSSLLSLIEQPTVIRLHIYNCKGFPATALSCCSNLIDLHLRNVEITSPEVNQVISRSKIPTPVSLYIVTGTSGLPALLNSASLHAGGLIVDFSRLQQATFEDMESQDEIGQAYELIKVSTRLEHLGVKTRITVDQPLELAGLGASLAINAYRTLKLLELFITVVGDDYIPLCGLNRGLKAIAGNNILEWLELNLVVESGEFRPTDSGDWPTFDSLLTESGAFPMLHRVSVGILWRSPFRDPREPMKSLRAYKFPRLVESKAVEFIFRPEFQVSIW